MKGRPMRGHLAELEGAAILATVPPLDVSGPRYDVAK
jgi:hypothetical protein